MTTAVLIGGALSHAQSHAQNSPSFTAYGAHRTRYESLDPQYRVFLGEDDQALTLQTSLRFELTWPKWQFVGELMDARAELNDAQSTLSPVIINALEPLQLMAVRAWDDVFGKGLASTLKFGRMALDFGSRRLIARGLYISAPHTFVGLDWSWQLSAGQAIRIFHVSPMLPQPLSREGMLANDIAIDEVANDRHLTGFLYSRAWPLAGHVLELYWLQSDSAETALAGKFDSYGLRSYIESEPGNWDYEFEYIEQTGRSPSLVSGALLRNLDHDSRSVHLDLGYTFANRFLPRVALLYAYASGDRDPDDFLDQRFDPLFGTAAPDFGPTSIYGAFQRANIDMTGVRVSFGPNPQWQARMTWRSLRLAAARDAWVATGLRDVTGAAGEELGGQFDVQLTWRPENRRLNMEFGAVHFTKGSFVERTAPLYADASNYFYVATSVAFLGAFER